MIKLNNNYYFLRHGEAESNVEPRFICSLPEPKKAHLTSRGKKQIQKIAQILKKKNIDLIFFSPLTRTKETAQIIKKTIKKPMILSQKLKELDFGIFNGLHPDVYWAYFEKPIQRFTKKIPQGETLNQCLKRIWSFFQKINQKYKNKNILIISHADPLWLLESKIKKLDRKQMIAAYRFRLKPGELRFFRKTSD